jgi:hypothetical protein
MRFVLMFVSLALFILAGTLIIFAGSGGTNLIVIIPIFIGIVSSFYLGRGMSSKSRVD